MAPKSPAQWRARPMEVSSWVRTLSAWAEIIIRPVWKHVGIARAKGVLIFMVRASRVQQLGFLVQPTRFLPDFTQQLRNPLQPRTVRNGPAGGHIAPRPVTTGTAMATRVEVF